MKKDIPLNNVLFIGVTSSIGVVLLFFTNLATWKTLGAYPLGVKIVQYPK